MAKHLLTLFSLFGALAAFAQPVITANPQNTTNCTNECVNLRVAANGMNLSFQWQVDDGTGFVNDTSSSANNDTLEVCDAGSTAPSSMDYRCVVSDNAGNADTSLTATVTLDSCLAPIADFTYTVDGLEACFTSTSLHAETVIWNFGNGLTNSSNVTTPCSDYTEEWYYDVTIYAFNAYGDDSTTKTISLVGLDEIDISTRVYPNPASDFIMIKSEKKINRLVLIDGLGRPVLQTVNTSQPINISALHAGVYHMLIERDGQIKQKRVVIQ
ncbi:MAG: hypothetical protein Salg2KO_20280 [Salibacteraceae bacterium]